MSSGRDAAPRCTQNMLQPHAHTHTFTTMNVLILTQLCMPPPRHRPGVLFRVAMAPQSTQTSCEGVCERPAHNNNDVVAEAAHLHRSSVSGEGGEVSGPVLFPASGTFDLRALRCRALLGKAAACRRKSDNEWELPELGVETRPPR